MLTDQEIYNLVRNNQTLANRIMLDIGRFTVALFSLAQGRDAENCCAGTGTLVVRGKDHCILTEYRRWQ